MNAVALAVYDVDGVGVLAPDPGQRGGENRELIIQGGLAESPRQIEFICWIDAPVTYYRVTTAETAYETYGVEAESPEEAAALVRSSVTRAELPSGPDGGGDDVEVIAVEDERGPVPLRA